MPPQVRTLIRTMSEANPLRGAPRLYGELKVYSDYYDRSRTHLSLSKDRVQFVASG